MNDFRPVVFIEGIFVLFTGLLMLAPALIDWIAGNPDARAFLVSSAIAVFLGGLMVTGCRVDRMDLTVRQGFLLTATSWIAVTAVGALPFLMADLRLGYTDAFFETMSGLTTTGATVLTGLDHMPPGILLWRSMLQWAGGIGIIVTAVALLPFLRVGGMQLFRMESSDTSEKMMPRAGQIAGSIAALYLGLTIACTIAYEAAGMTLFEAVNHAMTTISTGGFSTSDGSMGHFSSPLIHWISVLFMALGGLPFLLLIRAMQGRWRDFTGNSQIRNFCLLLTAATLSLTLWLVVDDGFTPFHALTQAAFNVVSVVTTTGYATADYTAWGSFPVMLFFLLTFIGGCTGSTAGGIKIFRFEMMYLMFRRQMVTNITPHDSSIPAYNGRDVPDDVFRAVGVFMFLFAFITVILTAMLALCGLDPVTSMTGAVTALANVGPGLGDIIGPAGNFSTLPDSAKWLLSAGMLIGRLEIISLLVLLSPSYWLG